MGSARIEVLWSPVHADKFVTWGTEIHLYEVVAIKDDSKWSGERLSQGTGAALLATSSSHQYVKCVDVCPRPEPDVLLGVGQANGKVALTTFGPSAFDALGLPGRELVPTHARQCNAVAWNPVDPGLLAAALDKYRSDHSVLLWDVRKGDPARPAAELCNSEAAHSLAWLGPQPHTLVVGASNKHIRIYDLRDPGRPVNCTQTKAVYGIAADAQNDCQLASHVENQAAIWDTRNFEKPILTLGQSRPVSKVLWCPTRRNMLAVLVRDSPAVLLHNVQHTTVGSEEVEPCVLERAVAVPGAGAGLASFSWHPAHESRLLAVSTSGTLIDHVVPERITLNWSPGSHLVWTHGRRGLKLVTDRDCVYARLGDVGVVMKRRAVGQYGLKEQLWLNGDVVDDDEKLRSVWHWLSLSHSLVEDGSMRGVPSRLPGVRCVLKLDSSQPTNGCALLKSETLCLPWSDVGDPNLHSTVRIYRSDERAKALLLCGWKFDRDTALGSFLDQLEGEGAFSRAAAIAVFNLKLRLAVAILNRGAASPRAPAAPNLNIVALALSGFSDSRNNMWRELCQTSVSQLTDPYLRAAFGFLTAEGDNYDAVLNESGMAVEDRVAFALTYLGDRRLADFLRVLTGKLVQEGDLAGILLTGASSHGVQLLQNYLDRTGDVQSASLLGIRMFEPEVVQDSVIQEWIASYRMLLNIWRLWHQRAHFDIAMNTFSPSEKPPQQVFVSCNFCGKSISAQMQGLSRNRNAFARLGATSQKLKCRKPLPRCAICLAHMGTPSGLHGDGRAGAAPSRLAEFSSWFTWCQSCRHGGHVAHVTQWFSDHSECPVTACACRCMSLDAAGKVTPALPHRS
ncbi:GATOR2 complex protein MIOS isoform X2 [Bacillus rossius redtenbacheri]|uniref:GATOR2 complex protein MIOS isoform X2 n=1 Tax=Bacillus rossius redtenbacheri TaxID=93214 RepID=UPI002FDCDA44